MTEKQRIKTEEELIRLSEMKVREREIIRELGENANPEDIYICGIDEAGRGPLAGPVAAAAVVLPAAFLLGENVFLSEGEPENLEGISWQEKDIEISDVMFRGLNDSKKVSEKNRERLFEEIIKYSRAGAVALVDAKRIDEINIRNATLEAMREAVGKVTESIGRKPHMLLIDGRDGLKMDIPEKSLVGGDAISVSIAAASILAKVTRDRYMTKLDEEYPLYGFAKHKAYPTKEHREAIKKHGICPEHRVTYLGNILK